MGEFLLLQQRSKHPGEMVIPPKASTSNFFFFRPQADEPATYLQDIRGGRVRTWGADWGDGGGWNYQRAAGRAAGALCIYLYILYIERERERETE